jgi:hypothetical protein
VWLARGNVEKAMATVEHVIESWDSRHFCKPSAFAGMLQMLCLLYRGDAMAAERIARSYARHYRGHGYTRVEPWKTTLASIYGPVSLACAFQAPRRRFIRETRAAIATLRRCPFPWARAFMALLEAGVQRLDGQLAEAIESYRLAARSLDEHDMLGHAAAARVRLAELLPAEQASPVRQLAEAWAEQEGVVNLNAWARMYAPGPPESLEGRR